MIINDNHWWSMIINDNQWKSKLLTKWEVVRCFCGTGDTSDTSDASDTSNTNTANSCLFLYLKVISHFKFVYFPTRLVLDLINIFSGQCTLSLETQLLWWKLSLKMRPWQFSVANISNQITIFKSRGIFRNAKSKKHLLFCICQID